VTYLSPEIAVDYLDAPFPFLVGLSKKLWTEIFTSQWDRMDEDIVVFDLHSQTIQNKQALPSKPQPYVAFMLKKFETCVNDMNEK